MRRKRGAPRRRGSTEVDLLWHASGWLLAAAWLGRAIEAHFGMRTIADLLADESGPAAANAAVSVIVPARNEEHEIERCLRSLLAQTHGAVEVVVVNDRSTDGTGQIIDRLATEAGPRLRALHLTELPPHWLGKTHAMWTGARCATGEWLLFTDADVLFKPQTITRAVAYAEGVEADHLVLFPTMRLAGVGERMMMSFFGAMALLTRPMWRVSNPRSKAHVGVGAFNMVRRSAYERIGTFEALRCDVVEDLGLGLLIKQQELRQRIVTGDGLISLRWAVGALGIMRALRKNFFAIVRYRVSLMLAAVFFTLLVVLVPFAGALFAPQKAKSGYVAALIGMTWLYAHSSRFIRVSAVYVLLSPLAAMAVAITMLNSALYSLVTGTVEWRGTKYSVSELRRELER